MTELVAQMRSGDMPSWTARTVAWGGIMSYGIGQFLAGAAAVIWGSLVLLDAFFLWSRTFTGQLPSSRFLHPQSMTLPFLAIAGGMFAKGPFVKPCLRRRQRIFGLGSCRAYLDLGVSARRRHLYEDRRGEIGAIVSPLEILPESDFEAVPGLIKRAEVEGDRNA